MTIIQMAWPEGKDGVVTSSWDDGVVTDRRLVDLFNQHGLRGTWNLNSGFLDKSKAQSGFKDYLASSEIQKLFEGHEVAVHTVSHPRPWLLTEDSLRMQILEDRRRLEDLMEVPITGFCHPYGCGESRVRLNGLLRGLGFAYARLSGERAALKFSPPDDFYNWRTAGHFKDRILEEWGVFEKMNQPCKIFYFWGHSWELEDRNEWGLMEEICRTIGSSSNHWHATNGQIVDYLQAWRMIRQTLDGRRVENRSGMPLWIRAGERFLELAPGKMEVIELR